MKDETELISIDELRRGLRLCHDNIRRFLRDVDVLLGDCSDWHAIALAIFALEELGKYKMLKDLKESTVEGGTVTVNKRCIRNHLLKQQVARELIPSEDIRLLDSSFGKALGEDFQAEDTFASHQVRLDCIYVDLKNGKWDSGAPVDPKLLKRFCDSILAALNNLGGPF